MTGTYAIRGFGTDIRHTLDEFHFAHKTLQGDGSITARIDSIENTDPWARTGVMIRKTLEPTSEHASLFVIPSGTVVFQWRSTQRGVGRRRVVSTKAAELPHWVRLTRRGNTFTAEHSSDGARWEEVTSRDPNGSGPVEIAMDGTAHLCLAVTSRDAGRTAEARISDVTFVGLVSPNGPLTVSEDIGLATMVWPTDKVGQRMAVDSNDVGPPPRPETRPLPFIDSELRAGDVEALTIPHGVSLGRLNYEEATKTYTVIGAGKDIGSTSDEFHFAHKELAGDGSIAARIDSVQPVSLWTKAGVMMRNALTSDSEYASVVITPADRVCFQYRLVAGQKAMTIQTDPHAVKLPHWVRLVRKGTTFKAQHSRDGIHWKELEGGDTVDPSTTTWPAVAEIQMKGSVHVGLAVTSRAGSATAEAKMSNVTVTGDVKPTGEFLWSEDIGFQMIMLPKDPSGSN